MWRPLAYLILIASLGLVPLEGKAGLEYAHRFQAGVHVQPGWWSWNLGSKQADKNNDQGWGKTRTAPYLGPELSYSVRIEMLELGVSYSFSRLMKDKMYFNPTTGIHGYRQDLGDGGINFHEWSASIGVVLLKSLRFELVPKAHFGWFNILAQHELQEHFGKSWFWSVGLQSRWLAGEHIGFYFEPRYTQGHMDPKVPKAMNEAHRFVRFGAAIGISWKL